MTGIVWLFVFSGLFRLDRSIHRSIENPCFASKYEGSGVFGGKSRKNPFKGLIGDFSVWFSQGKRSKAYFSATHEMLRYAV
ncbi:MAG: hypothetical protein HFH97_13275 [Lachnospiraceae bacterium]|nr:hypothetical protein [uncultured Acetatifactor sp.]MCI9573550.1 hypothetical protein [Lachnospiraceae bacterium]